MKAPKHGFAMGVGTQYGDQVRFRCQQGHVLHGEALVTCQASGEWSTLTPTCQRECASSHGTVIFTLMLSSFIFIVR